MLNVVVLNGRLTSDPELKYTPSNVAVTNFTLAVDRAFSGKEKVTDFINIVAWRSTAEFVSRYFQKGQLVAVQGSLQVREYTDKDGNRRRVYEVLAEHVHFAEAKRGKDTEHTAAVGQASNKSGDFDVGYMNISADDYGDLPF